MKLLWLHEHLFSADLPLAFSLFFATTPVASGSCLCVKALTSSYYSNYSVMTIVSPKLLCVCPKHDRIGS